jgi:flagellar hook-associated protein 1 FlgK
MSTGLSGLLAFRRALDVTGHNIANANTEGYSRQRVELVTRQATAFGNGYIGNGVRVASVTRNYDEFLTNQVRTSGGTLARLDVFAAQAERINNLFSDASNGLSASFQRFSNAIEGVAASPGSLAARQVMLGESRALVDKLRQFDTRLRDIDADTNSRLGMDVAEVTAIAENIARLNGQITRGIADTGQTPNDLLDQRDRLLEQLSNKLNVQIVPQDGGVVNVFVGKGQALVLNTTANELRLEPDVFDNARGNIVLVNDQSAINVSSSLGGGSIGGLLDFRSGMLDVARGNLGRIAVGLAAAVNGQHRAGMDLRGDLGSDLFNVGGVAAQSSRANTGSATLAVTRTDVNALTGADYIFEFDGSNYRLRNEADDSLVTLSGTGTVADPYRGAGLAIVVSGTPNAGDQFAIRPTREAIVDLAVAIGDPARIAIAAPISTTADANNIGSGSISGGVVVDASNPQLRSAVALQFTSSNTYSINGAGSFAYVPGSPIEVNGWRVEISGAPQNGDRFTVTDNLNGTGDNRNAQLLVDSLSRRTLAQGSASVNSAAAALVGEVGVATRQVTTNREAQSVLHRENIAAKDNVSGVNLDEEAAQMLRYQQAYQAMTQIIRTANAMFDALLAAAR